MFRPHLTPSALPCAVRLAVPLAAALSLGLFGAAGAHTPATAGSPADAPIFESEFHTFQVVTVADGLEDPWSIAFLPGGDILVTEKPGRLRIVRDGVLQPGSIAGVPEVRYQGQGGLLEVALHPDFESNRFVYLSYAKPRTAP